MKLDDVTADETEEEQTEDEETEETTSSTSSHVSLWMAEEPMVSGRDPTGNHNVDAYNELGTKGVLYDAFVEKSNGQNVWSRSDTTSHILAGYIPLVKSGIDTPEDVAKVATFVDHYTQLTELGVTNPEKLGRAIEAAITALAEHFDGNTAEAMGLYEPSADDIAEHVEMSDDLDAEAVIEALSE